MIKRGGVLICGGAAALVTADRTRAQTSEPVEEFRMEKAPAKAGAVLPVKDRSGKP